MLSPSVSGLLSRITPIDEQGAVFGTLTSAQTLARMISYSAANFLLGRVSTAAPYWGAFGVDLVALAVVGLRFRIAAPKRRISFRRAADWGGLDRDSRRSSSGRCSRSARARERPRRGARSRSGWPRPGLRAGRGAALRCSNAAAPWGFGSFVSNVHQPPGVPHRSRVVAWRRCVARRQEARRDRTATIQTLPERPRAAST